MLLVAQIAEAAQTVSGSYRLDPSESSVVFTDAPNTGYNVNVTLRDSQNNAVIIDQSNVEYIWTSENESIVIVGASTQCIDPVQPPCPHVTGGMIGDNPGSTRVNVVAKMSGQTIAQTSIAVTVHDYTTYTPPPTVYPTPSSSPTATPTSAPTPSPSASPTTSATATPKPSATPKTTPKPTATPSGSPVASLTPAPSSSPQTTPSNSMVAATASAKTGIKINLTAVATFLIITLSVLLGLGVPLGWYMVENNPALKLKLQEFMERVTRRN